MLQRPDAGNRLDAANARGYGFFAHDLQYPNVANALHVRPAAKLLRVETAGRSRIGNRHHANVVLRILVPEKRQRPGSQRFLQRRDVCLDLRVQPDLVVHLLLDVAQLFRIHVRKVRKVESQTLRRIQRPGLLHVRPQDIPKRRIHQVRPRVVADNPRPPLRIRHHRHAIPHAQSLFRYDFVRYQSRHRIKRSGHIREQLRFGVVVERAGIRHLPARLGVNRRAIENHFSALARLQLIHRPILCNDRFNPAILRRRPKIKIRLRLKRLRQLRIRRIRRFLRPALPRCPRPRALLIHGAVKSFFIKRHASIPNYGGNEISAKPVCFIDSIGVCARVDNRFLRRGRLLPRQNSRCFRSCFIHALRVHIFSQFFHSCSGAVKCVHRLLDVQI